MAFWNRKKEPPPPKRCDRCGRDKPAAQFLMPDQPNTCHPCGMIPAGVVLRECPACHEMRAPADFASKVELTDMHPSARKDDGHRAAATSFLLGACHHCKVQCGECKVIYARSTIEKVFPDFPSLICFDHYRQCSNEHIAVAPEKPPARATVGKTYGDWTYFTISRPIKTHFTTWEHICDDCLRQGFREPNFLPVLRQLEKLAQLEDEPASRSSEAPAAPAGAAIIGTDGTGTAVALPLKVRNRHLYIVGRTGSGKTVTLKNLIRQDMESGAGIGFLDPHGDAAFDLLGYVPEHRLKDVVYFCPTDEDCPTFNLLAAPYEPTKLTGDIVSALKMFFGDSWGFRMEQILTMTILTLLADRQNELHTFADLKRLLVHDEYRDTITARITNQQLADFWSYEFPKFPKDATAPITNKLSQFLMPMSPLERLFSSPRNDLDAFTMMNEGKIFLGNLSKGQLGDSAAFLIGALLTTALSQAALARVKIPEHERRDFFWYVDEFQNFAVSSFSSILSEARKYRLNLTLAHQYLDQVDNKLYSAIIGNVAAVICLPVSPNDANTMAQLMGTTRTVQPDGTLYDLNESVSQTARRWMVILSLVLRADRKGQYAAYRAVDHRDLVNEHLRIVAPDIVMRMIPDDDDFDEDDPKSSRFAPANFKESPKLRLVARVAILQTVVEFISDPHQRAVVPEGLKEVRWPSAQDFLTLEPLNGFVRIDNVDNVRRFSFPVPSEQPSDAVRAAVLAAQQQRLKDTPTQQPRAAAAAIAPTPPPADPDDFAF